MHRWCVCLSIRMVRRLWNGRLWPKADVQPDDRCARNFMPAICIAATVIFWL
jgi:hypothetical protein